jgi:hypothetical protein
MAAQDSRQSEMPVAALDCSDDNGEDPAKQGSKASPSSSGISTNQTPPCTYIFMLYTDISTKIPPILHLPQHTSHASASSSPGAAATAATAAQIVIPYIRRPTAIPAPLLTATHQMTSGLLSMTIPATTLILSSFNLSDKEEETTLNDTVSTRASVIEKPDSHCLNY